MSGVLFPDEGCDEYPKLTTGFCRKDCLLTRGLGKGSGPDSELGADDGISERRAFPLVPTSGGTDPARRFPSLLFLLGGRNCSVRSRVLARPRNDFWYSGVSMIMFAHFKLGNQTK